MPEILPDLIVTHNTMRNRELPETDYRTHLLIYHVRAGLGHLPPPDQVSDRKLLALVSHGYWCIACPYCYTGVAAEPTDPWFCCPACGSGGKWIEVVFPDHDTKSRIETILLYRPGFRHEAPFRNWYPTTESLDDLRRQNLERGDKVDEQPVPLLESGEVMDIEIVSVMRGG